MPQTAEKTQFLLNRGYFSIICVEKNLHFCEAKCRMTQLVRNPAHGMLFRSPTAINPHIMKEAVEMIGMFALGYVVTVVAVVALVRVFFPFDREKSGRDRAISKTKKTGRTPSRLRKVKLVNG